MKKIFFIITLATMARCSDIVVPVASTVPTTIPSAEQAANQQKPFNPGSLITYAALIIIMYALFHTSTKTKQEQQKCS